MAAARHQLDRKSALPITARRHGGFHCRLADAQGNRRAREREALTRDEEVQEIDERTLQVDGGAVSLHHPVDEAVRDCSLVADALRRAGERGPPRRHRRRRSVAAGGGSSDETVEAIFAQARDAEASAGEYLVDGDGTRSNEPCPCKSYVVTCAINIGS